MKRNPKALSRLISFFGVTIFQQAWQYNAQKNPQRLLRVSYPGGERGIRTPGGVTLNGFQDRRIRPLCHLS